MNPGKTIQRFEFVKLLQRILVVARDQLQDVLDEQTAQHENWQLAIYLAITASVRISLDTKE